MEILQSASKLVLLMIMITVCVGFLIGKLDTQAFMVIASGVSAFYFTNKGDASNNFLGK